MTQDLSLELASLPKSIWECILERVPGESLLFMSKTSRYFHIIIHQNPSLKASLALHLSCPHLVMFHLYTHQAHALSFELAEALLAKGATLPKYLIELIYTSQFQKPLPVGCLEFLVATGYREYQESLVLSSPIPIEDDEQVSSPGARDPIIDDRVEFMAALFEPTINLEKLKKIINIHGYVPALSPPSSEPQWELLWDGISHVVSLEPELGLFLAKHAGVSFTIANGHIMRRQLHRNETDLNYIKSLLETGFILDQNAVVSVLTWHELPIRGESICEALLQLIPQEDMEKHLISTLQFLFKDNTRSAIRNVDFLIDRFNAPDDLVSAAFLVDLPSDYSQIHTTTESFMYTIFGQEQGGMNDVIWPAMVSRYGADHVFVEACLIDFVIGGYLPVMIPKETLLSSPVLTSPHLDETFSPRSKKQYGILATLTGSQDQGLSELDETSDLATSDSIHAIIGLGVPFRPTVFMHLLKAIKVHRQVPARFVEYFSLLEKHLVSAPNDAESWLPVLQSVLDQPEWRRYLPHLESKNASPHLLSEQLESPDSLASASTMQGPSSTTPTLPFLGVPTAYAKGILSSISESVKRIDFMDQNVRRFATSLSSLVGLLTHEIVFKPEDDRRMKSQSEVSSANQEKKHAIEMVDSTLAPSDGESLSTKKLKLPFSEWRDELRRTNGRRRMTSFSATSPILPSLSALASSFQETSIHENGDSTFPEPTKTRGSASITWMTSWFR